MKKVIAAVFVAMVATSIHSSFADSDSCETQAFLAKQDDQKIFGSTVEQQMASDKEIDLTLGGCHLKISLDKTNRIEHAELVTNGIPIFQSDLNVPEFKVFTSEDLRTYRSQRLELTQSAFLATRNALQNCGCSKL